MFDKDEIVYLTAESKEVLRELDPKRVYVIGGIVDHNRMKGHCHEAAVAAGWKTAKLPLEGNVALGDHRKVLTVNHVFQILLKFQETGSWSKAMGGSVPERKMKGVAQPRAHGDDTAAPNSSTANSVNAPPSEELEQPRDARRGCAGGGLIDDDGNGAVVLERGSGPGEGASGGERGVEEGEGRE